MSEIGRALHRMHAGQSFVLERMTLLPKSAIVQDHDGGGLVIGPRDISGMAAHLNWRQRPGSCDRWRRPAEIPQPMCQSEFVTNQL